jgi:uncharacterized protein YcbX
MVVDRNYRFLTQRQFPRLALVSTKLEKNRLRLGTPGLDDLEVPLTLPTGSTIQAVVWNDTVLVVDTGDHAARWFTQALGGPARLVFMPEDARRIATRRGYSSQVSLADAYPFLLLSEESLNDLNSRLAEPVPMNRFRPNLVVRGCEPYAEDTWNEIRVGRLPFHVVKPCSRCVTTTVNQLTGEKGSEPLKTLATYRERDGNVYFGQNLIHGERGVLRVGDEVEVVGGSEKSGVRC